MARRANPIACGAWCGRGLHRACRLALAALLPPLVACGLPGTDRPPEAELAPPPPVGWTSYAGDAGSMRWSPLDELSPVSVAGLRPAWTWRTGERGFVDSISGDYVTPDRFEATPLAFGDTLYVVTPFNVAVALDAKTGQELWRFDPGATREGLIAGGHNGFVHRGLTAWHDGDGRRLLLASRTSLYLIDASTGQLVPSFGDGGRVDLASDLRWPANRRHIWQTSPPAVWGDIVVVGSAVADEIVHERDPPGDVQAFDLRTGRRLWRWDPVPPLGDPLRDSWGNRSAEVTGHVNVWAPISVDRAAGRVYLPVSTPSNDWFGGARPGDNLFAESLVCLDVRTGERLWHRQLVHHGLWDYDLAGPPLLVSAVQDGVSRDLVFVAGKTGYLYAFDRVTGEPIYPIEERPAPASDVPGEVTSASQPHPTWPPAFARQGFGPDDVNDLTPELHAQGLAAIAGRRTGPLFTPPSLQGTVVSPGWIGGAGWGATAADPDRGLLFVKSSNLPVLGRLVPADSGGGYTLDGTTPPPSPLMLRLPAYRTWYGARRAAPRIPIGKPPYGTLTAYELATGAIRWTVTVGDLPEVRAHPALRDTVVPLLGVYGAPGPLATAGGLVFLTGGGRTLYALRSDDGATVWSHDLGQIGYSNPMTYRTADGTQFVVVATGDGGTSSLQAFALPWTPPTLP